MSSFQKRKTIMSDTRYILRKKDMRDIERKLVEQFDFKLCFKNKKERIFKDDEFLITCKKKYISILVYEDEQKSKAQDIIKRIS